MASDLHNLASQNPQKFCQHFTLDRWGTAEITWAETQDWNHRAEITAGIAKAEEILPVLYCIQRATSTINATHFLPKVVVIEGIPVSTNQTATSCNLHFHNKHGFLFVCFLQQNMSWLYQCFTIKWEVRTLRQWYRSSTLYTRWGPQICL